MGIPKVEAAFHLPLRPVAEGIGLAAVAEIEPEVAEQLEVARYFRGAPNLRSGSSNVGVAGVDQCLGVASLGAAAGRVGLLPLEAQVGEADVGEGEADVGGEGHRTAVAFDVLAPLGVNHRSLGVFPEYEVHDPGDGVGPVLSRCPVPEYLESIQRNRWYGRQVGSLGTARDPCAQQCDDRSPVTAFAVNENERGIRGQRPQRGRTNEGRGVADGLLGDVVRRHQRRDEFVHIGTAVGEKVVSADHVDRNGGVGRRAVPAS